MMRNKEFVGIAVIGFIICFISFLFGRKKGYMKGYIEADNMVMNESSKSV